MKIHELKTVNPFFDDVFYNRKEFEVRKNDRDFKVGDRLKLIEVVPDGQRARYVFKDIQYILFGGQYGIEKGYVVLGLKEIPEAFVSPEITMIVDLKKGFVNDNEAKINSVKEFLEKTKQSILNNMGYPTK